jgi:hypothetical protein
MQVIKENKGQANRVVLFTTYPLYSVYDFNTGDRHTTLINPDDLANILDGHYQLTTPMVIDTLFEIAKNGIAYDKIEANFVISEDGSITIGGKSKLVKLVNNLEGYINHYKTWLSRPHYNQITIKLED